MRALLLLAPLLVACGSNPLESVTPADRVKYTIEALEAACGAYLSSASSHEPNLDELCKSVVKPVEVVPAPAPAAPPPVASGEGGRVALDAGGPGG